MYLLDTSSLSELIKRRPNEDFLARLRQVPPDSLFTAAICVMEMRYGVLLRPDHESLWQRIQKDVLPRVQVLEFGYREALVAGELLAHLKRTGRPVGFEDVLIGAIARSHGYTVVTHNLKHFQPQPHVKAEDWFSVESQ